LQRRNARIGAASPLRASAWTPWYTRQSPEKIVFALMIGMIGVGLVLFLAAPLIARAVVRGRGDPVGITRILQVVGVILMFAALIFRPHSPDTAAFPPPPDAPRQAPR
jgi:hypothetical protein